MAFRDLIVRAVKPDKLSCPKCELDRNKFVPSKIMAGSDIAFVGEAPGRNEVIIGQPFVGKAGKIIRSACREEGLVPESCSWLNVVKCLHRDARVVLPNLKTVKIKTLVDQAYRGYVLSFNGERFVSGKVVGTHTNKLGNRRWVRVTFDKARPWRGRSSGVVVTNDHEFLTEDGSWVRAENVGGRKILASWGFGSRAWDTLVGTMLGDATATSRHVGIVHSFRQASWVRLKSLVLGRDKTGRSRCGDYVHRYSLRSCIEVRRIRAMFYPDGKKIVPEGLTLSPQMLATWFMDDGYTRKRKNRRSGSEIATCGFDDASLIRLQKMLLDIGLVSRVSRSRRIVFNVDNSEKLVRMIARFVPAQMRYKLGGVAGLDKFDSSMWLSDCDSPVYATARVEEFKSDVKMTYCLTVEDHENFLTIGGLVHNCRPPNNATPDAQTIARCGKRYLYPELLTLKPKVVILLGASSFAYFFGKKEWDKSRHNFRRRGEFVFLPTWHPSYVNRKGGPFSPTGGKLYRAIRCDIKKARQYIDGTLYSDREYTLVKTAKEAKRWADHLIKQPMISADIEGTALRPWDPKARLLTVAFSWADKKAVCFPVDHHEIEDERLKAAVRKQLARVLAASNVKIWHNAKFDVPWLRQSGWTVNGKVVCTMIMAYLIDENKKRYGLKQLSAEDLEGYNDVIDGDEFKKVSLERLFYYNCEDADNTRRLFFIFRKRMDKQLWWVHNEIIIPASMAVAEAERVGLYWDVEGCRHLKAKLSAQTRDMTRKANKRMPPGMTVTSTNDLRKYLYEQEKYPVISETDKGTPQVNEYCLTILAENHKCKIAKDVIEIREMEKIVGTYLNAYPKFIAHDGRIHATCWFTHTVTGRTAFTSPNPQQLPRRKDVRELIMAEEGNEFIYGDLATAEMRIAGSLARDPFLIDVFKNDGDVHTHMGAEIAGIPYEQMDVDNNPEHKDWRQKAKPVNFGFLYGQMPPGFVKYAKAQYGIDFTLGQAENIRDRYFTKYAALPGWYKEVYEELYRFGMVRTELGRLRRFPDLFSVERWQQEAYERQAVNTKVQSVAADIMLLIFIHVQEHLMREKMKTRLVLTVHDSLLGEGPPEERPEIARRIDHFVNELSWPWLRVPMRMDLEKGVRWGRTKKMKKGEDF